MTVIFARGVSFTPIGIQQIKLGNHLWFRSSSFLVSAIFYFLWNQVCLHAMPPSCLFNLTLYLFLKICMLAHEENQFSGRVYSLLKGLLQSSCVSHSRGQIMTISSFHFSLLSVKAWPKSKTSKMVCKGQIPPPSWIWEAEHNDYCQSYILDFC